MVKTVPFLPFWISDDAKFRGTGWFGIQVKKPNNYLKKQK